MECVRLQPRSVSADMPFSIREAALKTIAWPWKHEVTWILVILVIISYNIRATSYLVNRRFIKCIVVPMFSFTFVIHCYSGSYRVQVSTSFI